MSQVVRRRVIISGRVQGVGFRAATWEQAKTHAGLSGSVRNLEDGRVEAVFQGPEAAVLAMVAWCGRGPSLCAVSGIEVVEESPTGESGEFRIERG